MQKRLDRQSPKGRHIQYNVQACTHAHHFTPWRFLVANNQKDLQPQRIGKMLRHLATAKININIKRLKREDFC